MPRANFQPNDQLSANLLSYLTQPFMFLHRSTQLIKKLTQAALHPILPRYHQSWSNIRRNLLKPRNRLLSQPGDRSAHPSTRALLRQGFASLYHLIDQVVPPCLMCPVHSHRRRITGLRRRSRRLSLGHADVDMSPRAKVFLASTSISRLMVLKIGLSNMVEVFVCLRWPQIG